MRIIKLNSDYLDIDLLNETIDVLSDGGVILYPTDTVYGLGANIFDKCAVNKIYNLKKRSKDKPLSICVSDVQNISLVANLGVEQENFVSDYLPGPYTFLLNKKDIVPWYVTPFTDKVGVRVPDSFISRLISSIFPIVTTSANISNNVTLNNPIDILEQLDDEVDLVLDVGVLDGNKPSTVIDLTKEVPTVVRS